ncbi:ABC transporter permease (plasmid) [Bacillus mycoides]|nr:ABC transporter permease [Bacillus mycoides]
MEKKADVSRFVSGAFQLSSVLLLLFVSIFIIYSNQFFIRKRKKEAGLYSLLGIPKLQLGKMLFFENLLIGTLALGLSIVIGSILSPIVLKGLILTIDLDIPTNFSISVKSIIHTCLVFLLLILYTSMRGYRFMYQLKLIELLQSEKKGELAPNSSKNKTLLAIFLIGSGYFLAVTIRNGFSTYFPPLIVAFYILLATVFGTYLFFSFAMVFLLQNAKNSKNKYYKGVNLITISQIFHRIQGHAKSLATIAILSAVTITAIGTTVSFYYNAAISSQKERPYSYSYVVPEDKRIDDKVQRAFASKKQTNPIIDQIRINLATIQGHFSGISVMLPSTFHILSQTDFNQISLMKKEPHTTKLSLQPNEAVILDPYFSNYKGGKITFSSKQNSYTLSIIHSYSSKISNFDQLMDLVVVVPDSIYKDVESTADIQQIANINVKNQKRSEELTTQLQSIFTPSEQETFQDYYTNFKSNMTITGTLMFIGVFLGVIFLLATGAMIYFKQLAEAFQDQQTYVMLRKIGITEKEIKKGIQKQISIVFLAPLLFGILHSLFALQGFSYLFSSFLPSGILIPVCASILIYCIIYAGYYYFTVHSYYQVVCEDNKK